MAPTPTLPEPIVGDTPAWCFDCGYSLTGLAPPVRCPECGVAYEPLLLVLCGIRSRTTRSPLRTVLWVVLAIVAMVLSQFIVVLFIAAPAVLVVSGIVLAVGTIAMLRTGRGEQRGTERFVFSPGTIVCKPLLPKQDPHPDDAHAIALPPDCRAALKRAGPFWRRLIIREYQHGREVRVVFDAGVRCPDATAQAVWHAIDATVARSGLREGSVDSPESG